jgi:hypothetical protein
MAPILRSLRGLALAASFVVAPSVAFAQLPATSPRPALPDRITPAVPISGPRLVLAAPYADTIYAVNVSVDVEANGKADINTLQLSGSAGDYNRQAVITWLKATTFRPAKRNGVPERATFRMSAEALKQADAPDSTAAALR